jgi:hypothetical protein
MNRFVSAVFVGALSFGCFIGCTKSANDETLANNVKAALYSDQLTKPANITVGVKDGTVTLTGDVTSSDIALEAMRVANGTAGVRGVNDQMTINGVAASTQAPSTTSTSTNTASNTSSSNTAPTGTDTANPYGSQPTPPPAVPNPPPGNSANVPPPPPRAEPVSVTVPAGEQVAVRTIDPIDSTTNQSGQEFRASLSSPLVSRGRTIVPAGADARLLLTAARDSGRIQGRPVLEVRLVEVRYHGQAVRVDSSVFAQTGASRGKQTAVRTGIGAAAGAVIGAIAGGGKGAAIGSAAGGGAGFGSDFFTRGPHVRIPSESVLQFRLEAPVTFRER